jgi:hypothetical protein
VQAQFSDIRFTVLPKHDHYGRAYTREITGLKSRSNHSSQQVTPRFIIYSENERANAMGMGLPTHGVLLSP